MYFADRIRVPKVDTTVARGSSNEHGNDAVRAAGTAPVRRRRGPAFDRRELQGASPQALAEMIRLADEVDAHYRAAAERIGLLYMSADAQGLERLTRSLDEPMRSTAEAERVFASLLHELRACAGGTA